MYWAEREIFLEKGTGICLNGSNMYKVRSFVSSLEISKLIIIRCGINSAPYDDQSLVSDSNFLVPFTYPSYGAVEIYFL